MMAGPSLGAFYCAQYGGEGLSTEPTVHLPNLGVVVIIGNRPFPWNSPR